MKAAIVRWLVVIGCVTGFGMGCKTTQPSRHVTDEHPGSVEVFHHPAEPTKPYREIGRLKDDGREEEQENIEKQMILKAAKMGGNAIMFEDPKQSGMEMLPFGFGAYKYTYSFRATVVLYQ